MSYTAGAFEGSMQSQLSTNRARDDATAPFVSVVIPCLNEANTIDHVLQNLAKQYESSKYEIVVVDGMSTDSTRNIVKRFIDTHPSIRILLVDNPARNIPTALNLGIGKSSGDIIVRMDGHSFPSPNYVHRCVELLASSEAVVVGMPWHITAGANSLRARAIALALSHPFGVGNSKYHYSAGSAEYVDQVPFGTFGRDLWKEIGGFNEALLTNEDYEFNYRVRRRGGRLLLDGSGHCVYFARPTMCQLARQYLRYGFWKAQMVKLHPLSIRWRQLVAPGFVAMSVFLAPASYFWQQALWILAIILLTYFSLAFLFAFLVARKSSDLRLALLLPITFFLLH